MYQFSIIAYK
ncbi:hypothetical protein F383_27286 [Gossypium arboreum]|uniref:Uncharacterized protein n=1 Tax=Gossypium arboreum TaxID=29729 RepID=A0A0B0P371_GOSAR|nr:hypothetical protein F383_27286 [Gossypium arboreum]